MKLRLKYEKEISLRKSTLKEIKYAIVGELEQLNANNILLENNVITFKNNEMEWRNNFSLMANLKEGKFELMESDNSTTIHLVCYYSILAPILVFIPLGIFLSIAQGPQFLLFCLMSGLSILIKKSIVTDNCDDLMLRLSNRQNCDS